MKFKIPYTLSNLKVLKKRSENYVRFVKIRRSKLEQYLKSTDVEIGWKEYFAICYRSFVINMFIFSVLFTTILGFLRAQYFLVYGVGASLLISSFVFLSQLNYPRMYSNKKAREIEKNLISALQDMKVQLNSGIPMFRILLSLSLSDYGEVSQEFKKITHEITSGTSQIDALETAGKINTSRYFRRVLWQISNAMRAGSDMGIVIDEEIKNLNDEQAIEIQTYGTKLNPLIMFYMLIAVIMPSLGISFFIIISSMLGLSVAISQIVFFLIFGLVIFMQIIFIGLIKSRRPSLL